MKSLVTLCLFICLFGVQAQTGSVAEEVSANMAARREALNKQIQAIEALHDERQRACWQRFAVNDCLREVRRSRHAALDPLRSLELELNEQERAWRSLQREQRLREKQEAVRQP